MSRLLNRDAESFRAISRSSGFSQWGQTGLKSSRSSTGKSNILSSFRTLRRAGTSGGSSTALVAVKRRSQTGTRSVNLPMHNTKC